MVIPTFVICRRLEVDIRSSFVEDLRVKATFLICRRLEGDSYVPHLSKA